MLDSSLLEIAHPQAKFADIVRAMAMASQQWLEARRGDQEQNFSREETLIAWLANDPDANFRIAKDVLFVEISVDQHASKSVDTKSLLGRIAYHQADRSHEFSEIVRRVSTATQLSRSPQLLQLASRVVKEHQPIKDVEKWAEELVRSMGRESD